MFGKKNNEIPTPSTTTNTPAEQEKRRFTDNLGNARTVIGVGITLHGDLQGKENVELSGTVDGNVQLESTLLICKGGKVKGNINAHNLIVEGAIQGDVIAREKIELRDACQVTGNLQAGSIAIAAGAFFQGTVKMLGNSSGGKRTEPLTYTEKRAEGSETRP